MTRSLQCGFGILIFVLFVDLLSKFWVHQTLPIMSPHYPMYPYGGVGIFQNLFGIEFSLSHLTNKGAAWGSFGQYQHILVYLRIVLILGLTAYIFFFNQCKNTQIPLCLVLAGALGNVIDYYLYGHVVDMLHFVLWGYDFPVFNIADSAVCLGVFWLMIVSAWQDTKCKIPQ